MLIPACLDRVHLMFWSKVKTTDREDPSTCETPSPGFVETSTGAGEDSGSGSGFSSHETASMHKASVMKNNLFMVFI